jgi:AcrR family transcriptional regulator
VSPRRVDHAERRRHVAAAVWRIVRRDGVAGVTVRRVAAEAGLSMGALRHFFTTQDELLAFSMRLIGERVRGRLGKLPPDEDVRASVRRALCEVLPLDDERQAEAEVWLAFVGFARSRPQLAALATTVDDELRQLMRRIVDALAATGRLRPGADPALEAERLHAVVDGLALHRALHPEGLDRSTMVAVLDAHLAELVADRPA